PGIEKVRIYLRRSLKIAHSFAAQRNSVKRKARTRAFNQRLLISRPRIGKISRGEKRSRFGLTHWPYVERRLAVTERLLLSRCALKHGLRLSRLLPCFQRRTSQFQRHHR